MLGQFSIVVALYGIFGPANCEETVARFEGGTYIRYDIEKLFATRKDKVTLRFKTLDAYGVLVYSCGKHGDFLLLEIKRGKLVYTGNFGSSSQTSGVHQIVLPHQYNDNQWHLLTLLRENATHVYFSVDDNKKLHISTADFVQLNLDEYLYVGGISDEQMNDKKCFDVRKKKIFVGCLGNLHFNSEALLYGAKEGFTGYKTVGEISFSCPNQPTNVVSIHTNRSYFRLERKERNDNKLNLTVEFRTFQLEGKIASLDCTKGKVQLLLLNGNPQLMMSFRRQSLNRAVTLPSTKKLDDGDWHVINLVILRAEKTVELVIDDERKEYKFPTFFTLKEELGEFKSDLIVGGNTPTIPALISCFRRIQMGSLEADLNPETISEKILISKGCSIKDACFPNPCLHSSTCSPRSDAFVCNCTGTEYTGPRCEKCVYKRTCAELKDSNEELKSGLYKLCSNNERIFTAYCDMHTKETVIHHNLKNRTRVDEGRVFGRDPHAIYVHALNYLAQNQRTVFDLIDASVSCRQYIRFDCYRSRLLSGISRLKYDTFQGARWLSRDYVVQHYWGGATAESRMCQCGMDRSCARDKRTGRAQDCNCDLGDSKWRKDDGYLTAKNLLPVSKIQFSKGPETNTEAHFSVGPLKCSGYTALPTVSHTTKRIRVVMATIPPTIIENSMFYNLTHFKNGSVNNEAAARGDIDSLFSKPWLVTIVCIGVLLCLLLVFLVFMLFRQHVGDIFYKCVYGDHSTKPRIEIEDYNRYSTATESQSDWDIHNLSTTFPTSTPAPSYGPTDDEESAMDLRCRTMEDLRGKRRFKRLKGWGSHTASAPTVIGSASNLCRYPSDKFIVNPSVLSDQLSDSKPTDVYASTDTAFSTTATDGEAISLIDTTASEFSQNAESIQSSLKESEQDSSSSSRKEEQKVLRSRKMKPREKFFHIPVAMHGCDPTKTYVLPVNGFKHRQPSSSMVRCSYPVEYNGHLTVLNNPNCHVASGRLVPITKGMCEFPHPTIQERSEEFSDDDNVSAYDNCYYNNARNSDGFYDGNEPDHDSSPSSETRLLFDDVSTREDCEREADEQIKLLKRRVIEKATSLDEN